MPFARCCWLTLASAVRRESSHKLCHHFDRLSTQRHRRSRGCIPSPNSKVDDSVWYVKELNTNNILTGTGERMGKATADNFGSVVREILSQVITGGARSEAGSLMQKRGTRALATQRAARRKTNSLHQLSTAT
jgi:hypothetical protein